MDKRQERHIGDHDWHSPEYVNDWIGRDVQRDDERRPLLQQMLERPGLASDAEIRVLDVGAGYGVVSEEVLRRFPRARITLLDFSEPMFEQARRRLARHSVQLTFVMGDLSNAQWTTTVGGPFDLAVSAIAIHNLRDHGLIAACYRAGRSVLKPGAMFLDSDLVSFSGGLDAHLEWISQGGFKRVECMLYREPLAQIAATA
jgi:ubiquinone/menaquinone biosynthesis C-methylase UbiE